MSNYHHHNSDSSTSAAGNPANTAVTDESLMTEHSPERGGGSVWGWPWRVLTFALWYVKEFLVANLKVTADTLRPKTKMKMRPAIIAVPAASVSDAEWSLISSLITLTPGTLTLSLSREHHILYVHGMFVDSRRSLVSEIQEMEDRMIGAMRFRPGPLSRPLQLPVVEPRFLPRREGD